MLIAGNIQATPDIVDIFDSGRESLPACVGLSVPEFCDGARIQKLNPKP